MEQVKIKEAKRSEIEKTYKNMGRKILSDQIFKHLSFEIGLFNRKNVEMNYLHLMKNNMEIGSGILVYKDKRKHFEFCYEKQLLETPFSCLLKNCYIDRPYRGFGYFSLMLSNFESRAIAHDMKQMILAVNKNNLNAIAIFTHLGFKTLKSLIYNEESFIVMKKDLM